MIENQQLRKLAILCMACTCALCISTTSPQQQSAKSVNSDAGMKPSPFVNDTQLFSQRLDAIKSFFSSFETGDYQQFAQHLPSNFTLTHPLFGKIPNNQMDLNQYHQKMSLSDEHVSIQGIFLDLNNHDIFAVQWGRSFSTKNGKQVIDKDNFLLFYFVPQSHKIQSVTVVYSTPEVIREAIK